MALGFLEDKDKESGIARAIYNNSEILILDESTNALDSKNEKKIIEEIFNNALNKTIIIIVSLQ